MPRKFDIDLFNEILKEHDQLLFAKEVTKNQVVLSNGLVIKDVEAARCKKRVMFGNTVWKSEFDRLYSLDAFTRQQAEKSARSKTSSLGGISCQKQHGDKIKNNLNTGHPWCKGLKGNYPYSHRHTAATKAKISAANSGPANGMYGKQLSHETKQQKSKLMKEKILSGQFTPNSNNRNTHWDAYFNGKRYRSSWECLYQFFDQDAEYESLRIRYQFNNQEFVYIIDFVNHTTKQVIEVKPQELLTDKKTAAKILAAKQWCTQFGYEFIVADKEFLINKGLPHTLTDFDVKTQHKILNLYEASTQKRN